MSSRCAFLITFSLLTVSCQQLGAGVRHDGTSAQGQESGDEPSLLLRLDKKPGKWFEGGTLHQATAGQWTFASPSNRLATCADFVVSLAARRGQRYRDMNEVREAAQALSDRLDRSAPRASSDTPLEELAERYWKPLED